MTNEENIELNNLLIKRASNWSEYNSLDIFLVKNSNLKENKIKVILCAFQFRL